VLLTSEGFSSATGLARQVTTLFTLAAEGLSKQQHYDWGLRALKTCLGAAGRILREVSSCSRLIVFRYVYCCYYRSSLSICSLCHYLYKRLALSIKSHWQTFYPTSPLLILASSCHPAGHAMLLQLYRLRRRGIKHPPPQQKLRLFCGQSVQQSCPHSLLRTTAGMHC
jgi:hypothetical protein